MVPRVGERALHEVEVLFGWNMNKLMKQHWVSTGLIYYVLMFKFQARLYLGFILQTLTNFDMAHKAWLGLEISLTKSLCYCWF